MAGPSKSSEEKLQDLARELENHERALATSAGPPPPAPEPARQMGPRERKTRSVLLWINLGGGLTIFLVAAMKGGAGSKPLMWPVYFAFVMACALGCYAFQIFYWNAFKQTAGWFRRAKN
jgi:hypothetical protein